MNMEHKFSESSIQHQLSVLQELHSMQQKQQLCDFILRCNDGNAVLVHKCVVMAASSVLRVMIEVSEVHEFLIPCKLLHSSYVVLNGIFLLQVKVCLCWMQWWISCTPESLH
jgi:hypothetical protein